MEKARKKSPTLIRHIGGKEGGRGGRGSRWAVFPLMGHTQHQEQGDHGISTLIFDVDAGAVGLLKPHYLHIPFRE